MIMEVYPHITKDCIECGKKLMEWEKMIFIHTCNECCKEHKKTA